MGPKIRRLVEYWHSRCRDGCLPGRQLIKPCELKPILSNLFLVDCPTRDDRDWTYRLIGTEISEHDGFDRTGKSVRDYFTGVAWPPVRAEYVMCMDDHRPVYRADTAFDRIARYSFEFERIFLPLARDGHNVDQVIGLIEYLPVGSLDHRLIA